MAVDPWNPDDYDKYRHERSQPFWDLAARQAAAGDAPDLGAAPAS
jgi:trans-aconitate methyltransferase